MNCRKQKNNQLLSLVVLVLALFAFQSCSNDDDIPIGTRGKVLSSELLNTYTKEGVIELMTSYDPTITIGFPPEYGIDMLKVIYETLDAKGNLTQASGLVIVPKGISSPLPLCSYQHGTILNKFDVPSTGSVEQLIGIGMASSGGYLSVVPDLLGLGDSPGLHPYCHSDSEASAVVDLLRAAKNYCAEENIALNDQLFLLGYSQGGHSTMAATKAIEQKHSNEFSLTASAPMAGPYDISGVMTDLMLSEIEYPAPYYLPYILFAFNDVYELYPSVSNFLQAPYDSLIPPYFDGTGEVVSGLGSLLPPIPIDIMTEEEEDAFRNNMNHPLRQVLAENDLWDWTPTSRIKIIHCNGDLHVPFQNAEVAYNSFIERGATQVELLNPLEGGNHETCVLFALLEAKVWFDSLKE